MITVFCHLKGDTLILPTLSQGWGWSRPQPPRPGGWRWPRSATLEGLERGPGLDRDPECQEPASCGLSGASALLRDHWVQSWAVRLETRQMQLTDLNQEPAFCAPGPWVHAATLLHPPFQPVTQLARRGGVREGGSCSSQRAELRVGCRGQRMTGDPSPSM